ncbi:hypothetical protein E1218_14115 [Kribbella turkmenica]|uniref:Uncharacterized protein n=1 Tax=Kribbella turkmenica TaxID=2530375 RepID=A0A4R4X6J9_9ACTN|nr:hypothetical protein [Kribbella turkmenica]TDD25899.1 hypothetical protein E1218_14115 [Kribbella turkmenica]
MAALDILRARSVGLGTELLIRATRGICDGSLLNAESGRADTSARLEDWTGVLSLYSADKKPTTVSATA